MVLVYLHKAVIGIVQNKGYTVKTTLCNNNINIIYCIQIIFLYVCIFLVFIAISAPLTSPEEEGEDRAEKLEKGTKVKRTLSSLRNRVTGSFNKDKVNLDHTHKVHNVTLQ